MKRPLLLVTLLLAPVTIMACGEDPKPTITFLGRVASTADSLPIPGVTAKIIQDSPYMSGVDEIGSDQTGPDGRFSVEVGPGPGYAFPNCSVLHLELDAPGYAPVNSPHADGPACDAHEGTLDLGDLWMTPLP